MLPVDALPAIEMNQAPFQIQVTAIVLETIGVLAEQNRRSLFRMMKIIGYFLDIHVLLSPEFLSSGIGHAAAAFRTGLFVPNTDGVAATSQT